MDEVKIPEVLEGDLLIGEAFFPISRLERSFVPPAFPGQTSTFEITFRAWGSDEREAIQRAYAGVIEDRKQLMLVLDSLRNNDAVQTILDVVIDDGFIASSDDNRGLFNIFYEIKEKSEDEVETGSDKNETKNNNNDNENQFVAGTQKTVKQINVLIKEFVEKIRLHALIKETIEDFLLYGEYPIRVEFKKGKGVTKLIDDMSPVHVIGVYDVDEPVKFFEFIPGQTSKFVEIAAEKVMHFCLAPRKLRLRIMRKRKSKNKKK